MVNILKRKKVIIILCILFVLIIFMLSGLNWLKNQPIETLLKWIHIDYVEEEVYSYNFHYRPEDKEKIEHLKMMIPELTKLSEDFFGDRHFLEQDLTIYLINKQDEPNPLLSGTGVYTSDNIMLLKSDTSDSQSLQNAFAHEMAHFYLHNTASQLGLGEGDLPDWYHEGFAELFAFRIARPLHLHKGVEYNVIPLNDIQRENEGYYSGTYLYMHYVAEYLLHKFNKDIFLDLMLTTKEKNDFETAFIDLTNIELETAHLLFQEDWEFINEIEELLKVEKEIEAEQKILAYFKERGPYFYESPYIYQLLAGIYLKQERFEEALEMIERRLEFNDNPTIYFQAAEIAYNIDKAKAIEFAEQAVESAKRTDWDSQMFEDWLDEKNK
ncbi:hypothetical protein [Bacillus sp. PS06]|uniref:hypothetical protein n=1 Tax=Bacillus sp. PS06 TaxID=2764176 RepID=UPI0017853C27|nr:hypothetical protein [Bacillus sp. PS06]MBD8067940.1 hypothetical protein [Bacillus sp. PS06]